MNIEVILRAVPSANKDARRVAGFLTAVASKASEIIASGGDARLLLQAASGLMYRWVDRGRRLSLGDLFRDPYKALREETRRFAVEWELDNDFREMMG